MTFDPKSLGAVKINNSEKNDNFDPSSLGATKISNVSREATQNSKSNDQSLFLRRLKDIAMAESESPGNPLMASSMVPYYKSIGIGIGEAGQNLVNLGSKLLGKKPINIFDSNKAYDPGVAKFARETIPLTIPFAGESKLISKIEKLIPSTESAGVKGIASGIGRGLIRGGAKTAVRTPYGAAFGAGSEAIEDKDANSQSIIHAAKVGAALNALIPGAMDLVPGAYKGLINQYKNLSKKVKEDNSGPLTPKQASILHNSLKDDILSFPDLIKSPKLQGFYHGILKYIPFAGIAKKQSDAIERLEDDSAKTYIGIAGNNSEIDPASSRKSIIDNIQSHVSNQSKELSPKFENINQEQVKFEPIESKSYAQELLEEDKKSLDSGLGGTLTSRMRSDLHSIGKKNERTESDIEKSLPEKYKVKIKELTTKETPSTNIGVVRNSIRKYKEKADELRGKGNLNDARIYSQLAEHQEHDLQNSLLKNGNSESYKDYIKLNKEYSNKIVPFLHPEKPGMKQIIDGTVNVNSSSELENILKDSNNFDAINQLPQKIKNQIFTRLLNSNIDDKLNTRSEKLVDAYSKLGSYEKDLLSLNNKNSFDNLSKRVKQLKPVLDNTKSKIWKTFYHLKFYGYALGIPIAHMLHTVTPLASAAIPLSVIGRVLSSKKLMDAYKTGKAPEMNNIPKISRLLVKSGSTYGDN